MPLGWNNKRKNSNNKAINKYKSTPTGNHINNTDQG